MSPVTAIMADDGIWPRAIMCNAVNKRIISGKLTVVLVPRPFTSVY